MYQFGSMIARANLVAVRKCPANFARRAASTCINSTFSPTKTYERRPIITNKPIFSVRRFSSVNSNDSATDSLTELEYEQFSSVTLEHLSDYFDELVETHKELEAADVVYQVSRNCRFWCSSLIEIILYPEWSVNSQLREQ